MGVYQLYISHPEVLSTLWADNSPNSEEVIRECAAYTIIDTLYLMYVDREALDSTLHEKTWKLWATGIYKSAFLSSIFERVKVEYPTDFVDGVERAWAQQN